MITEFIEDLCDELDIDVPKISYDTSEFPSDTMQAMYDGDTIFIRKKEKPDPDYLFAIAHELRHAWQMEKHKSVYFSDYKDRSQLNLEEYNLQPAEVDAHAFASIVMIDWFGLQPLYQGMSGKVVKAIKNRINSIRLEL